MRVNPLGASGNLPTVAAGEARGPVGGVRPYHEANSAGRVPVERVIEGELLDKRSGAVDSDAARRWLLGNAQRQGAAGAGDLYSSRAHAAISRYLDTAFISAARTEARVAIDLYA